MWIFGARLGALKWIVGGSMVGLLGVVAALVVALVVLGAVVRFVRSRFGRGALLRLGYVPTDRGRYIRSVGAVRVDYRPRGEWTARIGVYAAADFVTEPRSKGAAAPSDADAFSTGDPELDGARSFWSERPPFAKQILADPAVKAVLLSMPAASVALRGDELLVEIARPASADHERVLRLARSLAATAAATGNIGTRPPQEGGGTAPAPG